jgi:hypothetical protein
MVAAALLIAVTVFLVSRWSPLDAAKTFLNPQWASWPQGAGLFALGVWAGEAGNLDDLTGRARQLGSTALATTALLVAMAAYEQARGQAGSALHGAGWPIMLGVVLYGFISVAFTAWFIALIRASSRMLCRVTVPPTCLSEGPTSRWRVVNQEGPARPRPTSQERS